MPYVSNQNELPVSFNLSRPVHVHQPRVVPQNDQNVINGTVWGVVGSALAYITVERGYELLLLNVSSTARFTANFFGLPIGQEIAKTALLGTAALVCLKNADSNLGKPSGIKGAFWGLAGLKFAIDAIKTFQAADELRNPFIAAVAGFDSATALIGAVAIGGVALNCFSNASQNFRNSER